MASKIGVLLGTFIAGAALGALWIVAKTGSLEESFPAWPFVWLLSSRPASYDGGQILLVVAVLLVLVALFLSVMYWSQRVERAGYLATLYRDFVRDYEFKRLAEDVEEKFRRGGYHEEVLRDYEWLKESRKPKPDPEFKDALWADPATRVGELIGEEMAAGRTRRPGGGTRLPFGTGTGTGTGTGHPPTDEESARQEREYQAWLDFEPQAREWANKVHEEAKRRYEPDRKEKESAAEERADAAVNIDFAALRGRGSEFVLEFTAIVVIIFAAVVLAIVDFLEPDHVATLLAAIAGYVLGRATTRTKGAADEAAGGTTTVEKREPVPDEQLSQLFSALRNESSKPDQPPTVSITRPVPTGEQYKTDESPIAVGGRAHDDKGVAEVKWRNSKTDSSGVANLGEGTTARTWRIHELALEHGINEIAVTARDLSGNVSEPATITVKYEPGEGSPGAEESKAAEVSTSEASAPRKSFVWSEKGKLYHHPDCPYAERISPKNRRSGSPPQAMTGHTCVEAPSAS